MSGRDKILERLLQSQSTYPVTNSVISHIEFENPEERFKETLSAIGGNVIDIESKEDVSAYVNRTFPQGRVITTLYSTEESDTPLFSSKSLADVKVAVLQGKFAVAENGAVWITDEDMYDRSLPFICENLVLAVERNNILSNLREAYSIIENSKYQFGTFISGPSKTADIEQSLVLGAHGPKSLTVCLYNGPIESTMKQKNQT